VGVALSSKQAFLGLCIQRGSATLPERGVQDPNIWGAAPGEDAMLGLMQDWPLLLSRVIDHAAEQFGHREIISRSIEGPIHRETYAQARHRALRVAQRLSRDGIGPGDRVATLAWNSWRHVEAWYGITGIGAIYHTVNPRLFPEQIVWIINHAQDRVVMVDLTFVPLLEAIADKLPSVERYIILTDAAHMPQTGLRAAVAFEDWLAEADGDFRWSTFDERTAAGLCYTSGTTGNPKGVLYSHRSNVLHSMSLCTPDGFALSSRDVILPVVPMFHANSWSIAFSAPMMGANLVMPGAKLDGASLYELMESERVTMAAGVPTVWMMLLQHLQSHNKRLSTVQRMLIGGSACPRAMIVAFERDYGIRVCHAWGMTEMSPVGSFGSVKPQFGDLAGEALYDLKSKQGHAFFGVQMKITDDAGKPLPWDGKTFGRLKVAGFAVASAYFGLEDQPILDEEGFFDTGDVATIDADGYMQITDRSKDVIKSGGEWISSIELENIAVAHPDVAEAAVIGAQHPRWGERPLLVVVPKPDHAIDAEQVLDFMRGKCARWWMPDDVQVIDEIPHTATGKINKLRLRELFADYRLPHVGGG
jgi:fatty-acyl-CoA synthase